MDSSVQSTVFFAVFKPLASFPYSSSLLEGNPGRVFFDHTLLTIVMRDGKARKIISSRAFVPIEATSKSLAEMPKEVM